MRIGEHRPEVDWPITIEQGAPPTLAVWKFASCDGCQLTILDCEDELLTIADRVRIAYFPEATSGVVDGPYDISLVEGSITTPHDRDRIHEIRASSRLLVTIGACATAGGVQALRNGADIEAFTSIVYAQPSYIEVLGESTPIADHVEVDLELRGCPIDPGQLVGVLASLLNRHLVTPPTTSVCVECKAAGSTCLLVAGGTPCLGPITQGGCGALCPSFDRGCYGCFGPKEHPNVAGLRLQFAELGVDDEATDRLLSTFNVTAFAAAASADTSPRSER